MKHEFKEVVFKDSKVLILGSFPSVKSREEKFYYMHKQNRFYNVLARVLDDTDFLNKEINIKINALQKHKIALYDVVEECDIVLSDDNSITNVKPINLKKIISQSSIKCILLNGRKAYELFLKYFKDCSLDYYLMPSTSPRNARCSLENLISKYKIILKYTN